MSDCRRPLRARLKNRYAYLVNELIPSLYVDVLYQEEVLSDQEKEKLAQIHCRHEQAKRFVDILLRKSEESIEKFCNVVKSEKSKQPHIYEELFREGQSTIAGQVGNEQQADDSNDSSSAVASSSLKAPAEVKVDSQWEELVTPLLPDVVTALRPILLLDHLRAARLVTAGEYKHLNDESLSEISRARELLNSMLPEKGEGSFAKFCEVLSVVEGQRHILSDILIIDLATPLTEDPEATSDESPMDVSAQHSFAVPGPTEDIETVQEQPVASTDRELQGNETSDVSTVGQSAETGEEQKTSLTTSVGGLPAVRKRQQNNGSCPLAKRAYREFATFFFKPEHLGLMQPIENLICSMCCTCFAIEQEKVMFTSAEMADVKKLLEVWGCPCYCDLDSKLAVLVVHGIEPHQIDERRCKILESMIVAHLQKVNPKIELPSGDCSVLEIVRSSSFIVLLLSTNLYISLLCALGNTEARMDLATSLQEALPGSKKAVLRLGGLPPLVLFSETSSSADDGKQQAGVPGLGSSPQMQTISTDAVEGQDDDSVLGHVTTRPLPRKPCACNDEDQHIPVICRGLHGALCMELVRKSSSRGKAVKYKEEYLSARDFHEKACSEYTKGESWKMGILRKEDSKPLQCVFDEWYGDRRSGYRSSKKPPTTAHVFLLPSLCVGQAEPKQLLESATCQLKDTVERVITVIDKMASVRMEQAPEWKNIMLKEKDAVDELTDSHFSIAIVGVTGMGKSTFLNAMLMYDTKSAQGIVPKSGVKPCTAVPIVVKCRTTMTSDEKPFKGIVNLISFEEFEEEYRVLLNDLVSEPDDAWSGADEAREASMEKLQALFGTEIKEGDTFDTLQNKFPAVWSRIIETLDEGVVTIEADSKEELRKKVRKYTTTDKEVMDGTSIQTWPLVRTVEMEVSEADILQQGVEFCYIPGLEFDSKARTAISKEFLADRCDHVWLVTEIIRVLSCKSLSDLLVKQLAAKLTEMSFDIVVTKTDDGVDDVDDEEFDRIVRQCHEACIPCSEAKTTEKEKQASFANNRMNLAKKKLPTLVSKQLSVKADDINILTVSSTEHSRLMKKDPTNPPRLFENDQQTGIPEARARAQTLAHLNALTSLSHILSSVDENVSMIWRSLDEYEPQQRDSRKKLECEFNLTMKKLEDEILERAEGFENWTDPMSSFYSNTFYPRLEDALQKQTENFDKTVSSWIWMSEMLFRLIYNRGGRYTLPQPQRQTRQSSPRKRGVTEFNFVRDLTKDISLLYDLWFYDFNDIIADTRKRIEDSSSYLKERAKEDIKPLISSVWPQKTRQEAEKWLDTSLQKTMTKCERSLRRVIGSFSSNAQEQIDEAVESVLTPMFQEYKVKKVRVRDLKEYVRQSMQNNKEEIRKTLLERQKKAADELKQRIIQCGKDALKAVIETARKRYGFMWCEMPEGQLKEIREKWKAELTLARSHLDEIEKSCKELAERIR